MNHYKILDGDTRFRTHQYLVDEVEDLKYLPTEEIGSFVLVAATSTVYVLNNKNEWVAL